MKGLKLRLPWSSKATTQQPVDAGKSCGESDSVHSGIDQLISRMTAQPPIVAGRDPFEDSSVERPKLLHLPGQFTGGSLAGGSLAAGSLDSSILGQFPGMLGGPTDQLQAREIDAALLELPLPTEGADLVRSMPGVVAVHARLGTGTFGEVFQCTMKGMEMQVAIKVLHKGSDMKQKREIELQGQLKHPNLVQLYRVLEGPGTPFALVLELCAGGCLKSLLHNPVTQGAARSLGLYARVRAMLNIADAVQYLHFQSIVHRDIKSENAFLLHPVQVPMFELPPVKLGDLGLARPLESEMTQCTGTWRYMAPEVVVSNTYTEAADIFSCGLMLHELVTGNVPFGNINGLRVTQSILAGKRPSLNELPYGPDGLALRKLLEATWCEEPGKRISAPIFADSLRAIVVANQGA